MDPTIQPANQQRFYPHLALFDPPQPEREAMEEEMRVDEVVEIVTRYEKIPDFDSKEDQVQSEKHIAFYAEPSEGRTYGSVLRERPLTNLDIWI